MRLNTNIMDTNLINQLKMKKIYAIIAMGLWGVSVAMAGIPEQPENVTGSASFDDTGLKITVSAKAPVEYYNWGSPNTPIEEGTEVTLSFERTCYALEEYSKEVYSAVTTPGGVVTFDDREVQPGNKYTYVCYAIVDGSRSYGTGVEDIYVGVKPAPPTVELATTDGEAPVILTITAPDKSTDGSRLEGTMSIRVERPAQFYGDEAVQVASLADVVPGQTVNCSDALEGVELPAKVTYDIVAVTSLGSSDVLRKTIFVGHDVPAEPTDIQAVLNADGSVTVSWTAPTMGKNGEPVETPLFYDVTRSDNKVIATRTEATSVTDPCDDLSQPTEFNYKIKVYNQYGGEEYAFSNNVVNGPAYSLPFFESFNGLSEFFKTPDNIWSVESEGYYGWYVTDYDYWFSTLNGVGGDDDGYAECIFYFGLALPEYRLASSDINLSETTYPVASFHYVPLDFGHSVRLEVTEGDDTVTLLDQPVREGYAPGAYKWRKVFVPLADYAGSEKIRLTFVAVDADSLDESDTLFIDDILVDDYPIVEKPVAVFDPATGTVTVSWNDPSTETQTATHFTVYVNGEQAASNIRFTSCTLRDMEDVSGCEISVAAHYGELATPQSEPFVFASNSIGGIDSDNSGIVEFFNLQGIRIQQPEPGTTVIRRVTDASGKVSTSKIIVK